MALRVQDKIIFVNKMEFPTRHRKTTRKKRFCVKHCHSSRDRIINLSFHELPRQGTCKIARNKIYFLKIIVLSSSLLHSCCSSLFLLLATKYHDGLIYIINQSINHCSYVEPTAFLHCKSKCFTTKCVKITLNTLSKCVIGGRCVKKTRKPRVMR